MSQQPPDPTRWLADLMKAEHTGVEQQRFPGRRRIRRPGISPGHHPARSGHALHQEQANRAPPGRPDAGCGLPRHRPDAAVRSRLAGPTAGPRPLSRRPPRVRCRCSSSSCKALPIAAACSSGSLVSASASPAWAFAAFSCALVALSCGSRLPWLLTPPSVKMLATLLISPMTTVPSFGASTSAPAGFDAMLLLSELPFASVLSLAARAAHRAVRRPVQIAVHYLRRQPGRQGLSVLADWGHWSRTGCRSSHGGSRRSEWHTRSRGRPGSRVRPDVLSARCN